jgi:hypothetical protein
MKEKPKIPSLPRVMPGGDFVEQWVAIYRGDVADHDEDLERLWKRVDRKGIADDCIFYNVPRPGVIYA